MARKSREEEPCGNWMDTYGDMVTLLLTFFVMLFSMSSVDAEKWQMLVEAFTNSGKETSQVVLVPEGDGDQISDNKGETNATEVDITNSLPENIDQLYEYMKAYVEANEMQGSIQIEKGEGSVFIRFEDNIFFQPDSYYMLKSGFPVMDFLGNCLKNVEEQIVTININGHTADVPNVKNYQINDRRLSSERAASVAVYLEENKAIDPRKIMAIGYGKNYPVATNETDEGRKQNRRVDMIIVGDSATLSNEAIVTKVLENTFNTNDYPDSGSSADILLPKTEVGAAVPTPVPLNEAVGNTPGADAPGAGENASSGEQSPPEEPAASSEAQSTPETSNGDLQAQSGEGEASISSGNSGRIGEGAASGSGAGEQQGAEGLDPLIAEMAS